MQNSFLRSVVKLLPVVIFVSLGIANLSAQIQPVGLQQQIPPGEYSALVDLHNFLNPNEPIPGWLNPEASQWPGVTVSGFSADENGTVLSGGNVTGIMLPGMNLTGIMPSTFSSFERLEAVDLSNNQITGTINESLGGLLSLRNLLLSSNKLSGKIPVELGNLPELGFLDLSHNQLSGNIPEAFSALQRLAELKLQHNNLSGELPAVLATLGNLGYIDLQGNYFSTNAPSGNMALVEELVASGDVVLFHSQKLPPKIEYTFDQSLSQLTLTIPATDGLPYKVKSTTDFINWQIDMLDSTGGQGVLTIQVEGSGRFYQVVYE
jgi:hypothetical protein